MSRRGPPQPRWVDRLMYGLPRAPCRVGRAGADPRDLRAVSHWAGPRPARDLPRVEARRAVQRPEGPDEPGGPTRGAHDQGHARADLLDLPHERPGGRESDPRHFGAALLLSLRRGL